MASQKEKKQEPLEKQLWKTADKLRKNIDAAEYKHIVLGFIFLKYISDSLVINYHQIQTLEKLRDNLLPKLMSGEIKTGLEVC